MQQPGPAGSFSPPPFAFFNFTRLCFRVYYRTKLSMKDMIQYRTPLLVNSPYDHTWHTSTPSARTRNDNATAPSPAFSVTLLRIGQHASNSIAGVTHQDQCCLFLRYVYAWHCVLSQHLPSSSENNTRTLLGYSVPVTALVQRAHVRHMHRSTSIGVSHELRALSALKRCAAWRAFSRANSTFGPSVELAALIPPRLKDAVASDDTLPLTIVLHGLLGSANNWRTLLSREDTLPGRFVCALDLRNHGRSQHADSMTYQVLLCRVKFVHMCMHLFISHCACNRTLICAHANL